MQNHQQYPSMAKAQVQDALLFHLGNGLPFGVACDESGVNPVIVHEWSKLSKFNRRLQRAIRQSKSRRQS